MKTKLKQILLIGLTILLLTGCVSLQSSTKLDLPAIAPDFASMPIDAATITSAVAVQAVTPPLENFGTVTFAEGADSSPAIQLGAEKFGFTGAVLFVHIPAKETTPGLVAGEIEYTDALERKATILYRAKFTKTGDQYTVTKLDVSPSYKDDPCVDITVVPASELLKAPLKSYTDLLTFLADKGLSVAEFANSGMQDFAIFAVGKDWAKPGSTLTVAISAKKTGETGYEKASEAFNVDGWPVAVASGKINPANTTDPLYAKVSFNHGSGVTSVSALLGISQPTLLGIYQLSALEK